MPLESRSSIILSLIPHGKIPIIYQSLNFPDSFPGISSIDHVSPLQVAQFLEDFGVTKVGGTRCGRYIHESFRE